MSSLTFLNSASNRESASVEFTIQRSLPERSSTYYAVFVLISLSGVSSGSRSRGRVLLLLIGKVLGLSLSPYND